MALEPGGYLFATIHRAENRSREAIRSWTAMLRAVARPDLPVVLALHPGTRVALEASNEGLGPHVRVTEPLGYRSSLALQLHAAAVLTDSGGIQREAGWLGVPCLVLRESTEWVELLAAPDGQMVLVGLDTDLAIGALARWAPAGSTEALAAGRSRGAVIEPSGAASAITARLATDDDGSRVPGPGPARIA
jgi:UDP-N-acetylglucosamine 2-epimerase